MLSTDCIGVVKCTLYKSRQAECCNAHLNVFKLLAAYGRDDCSGLQAAPAMMAPTSDLPIMCIFPDEFFGMHLHARVAHGVAPPGEID
ncbi:hypothetical protein QTL95_12005 [Rhizobium sp. S152]|uniref:hypothetical protein n=1 Tax=Rhizobium sp. S152 TaxID=3055038 RepID=UPI0025A955A8|nr:hypothetical protein [Rhizobium sp. S152]MDM9626625.1 hypothetical protein [Rhizobium sp. S152]